MSIDQSALRFVVLHHEGIDDPHFDLLMEYQPGSPLQAFRCPAWPITRRTPLVALPDHRREYLEYEGPISGNRGRVRRVASGTVDRQPESQLIRLLFARNNPTILLHAQTVAPYGEPAESD